MFDSLKQIREAWDEEQFIFLSHIGKPANRVSIVIPSQSVNRIHISIMKHYGSGIINTALPDSLCRKISLPFLDSLYTGISSRYPIIKRMYMNRSIENTSYSISLDHIQCKSGATDEDRAMTISTLGDLAASYQNEPTTNLNLVNKFGSLFKIPGHVRINRGSHGLLKKKLSITELSLAICEVTNQAPSISNTELLDHDSGKFLSISKAKDLAQELGHPFVEAKTVINLWRSLLKIPKDKIMPH